MVATLEKRSMERFSLQLSARIVSRSEGEDQEVIDLVTTNICACGAFFPTENPLPAGTNVNIDVVLPLSHFRNSEMNYIQLKDSLIKVSGAVIRTDEIGMAICLDGDYKILPLPGGGKIH